MSLGGKGLTKHNLYWVLQQRSAIAEFKACSDFQESQISFIMW
jgi:hypothetical protein